MIWKSIAQKRIRKNLNRPRPTGSSEKILILFNENFPVDKSFIDQLAHIFNIPLLNVQTLVFEKIPQNPDFQSVTGKSFGFFGQIKDENLKKILDQNFDIFIDLTSLSNLHEQLLSSYVKSRFRIGITDISPEFYDLMLHVGNSARLLNDIKTYWPQLQFENHTR